MIEKGKHVHILAGDFNLNPHRLFQADGEMKNSFEMNNWFATGSRFTVTNAGKEERGYDFFLVDETLQKQATVHQTVWRSSFGKSGGAIGLSDHDPVLLQIDFHERYLNRNTFRGGPPMKKTTN